MGRDVLSSVAFDAVAARTRAAGSTTYAGEQRIREGRGLNPLVDPKGGGLIRRSLSWYEPKGERFSLLRGVAMPEETLLDTTGSMGGNVEIAMRVLPKTYDLLATGASPIMGRYDLQTATSIFGDVSDHFVLQRSEFEFDERIAEQMTNMFPERGGGDSDEDPQYGLAAAAFLTGASIYDYGLKSFHFTVSDARGRSRLDKGTLIRVFGETVFEKMNENGTKHGFSIDPEHLPDTKEVVQHLLKRAHAFFLQVGDSDGATRFWTGLYGTERVIKIPRTELLPQIKAAVMGLTEGVLDLQSVVEYLAGTGISKTEAKAVANAVSDIPIGAQTTLENFAKIPLKGAIFSKKGELWPVSSGENVPEESGAEESAGKSSMWS